MSAALGNPVKFDTPLLAEGIEDNVIAKKVQGNVSGVDQ